MHLIIDKNWKKNTRYMEPRMILNRYGNDSNVIKEEWSYLTRSLPKNTTIGVAIVSDEDSDLNGSIGECLLRLISPFDHRRNASTTTSSPLFLEEMTNEWTSSKAENFFAPYSQHLSYEIESIMTSSEFVVAAASSKARFYRRSSTGTQRKFLIRTALDLRQFRVGEFIDIEFSATDKGISIWLINRCLFLNQRSLN